MPKKEDSLLPTECTQDSFSLHPLSGPQVRGQFDGGAITSDGGGLLLREVEKRTRIIEQFAACFTDHRKQIGRASCRERVCQYV